MTADNDMYRPKYFAPTKKTSVIPVSGSDLAVMLWSNTKTCEESGTIEVTISGEDLTVPRAELLMRIIKAGLEKYNNNNIHLYVATQLDDFKAYDADIQGSVDIEKRNKDKDKRNMESFIDMAIEALNRVDEGSRSGQSLDDTLQLALDSEQGITRPSANATENTAVVPITLRSVPGAQYAHGRKPGRKTTSTEKDVEKVVDSALSQNFPPEARIYLKTKLTEQLAGKVRPSDLIKTVTDAYHSIPPDYFLLPTTPADARESRIALYTEDVPKVVVPNLVHALEM